MSLWNILSQTKMNNQNEFKLSSIGVIHTAFKQKLSIPRQPGLAPSAQGIIKLNSDYAREDTLRGLESFDYLWIFFWCHASNSWRETVKPPRLGGKEKVGVFATRSPHRPNPIGLSAVKLERITSDFELIVSGIDILDQTPILDIKPYIHMWDSHPNASLGWINKQPDMPVYAVKWEDKIQKQELPISLVQIISETLKFNPRPAYDKSLNRHYTHQVDEFDITWSFDGEVVWINDVLRCDN